MGFQFSGEKVKQKRKEIGLTLEELGKKISVSAAQISYIESGAREPSASGIGKLADALGVTPGYFYEAADGQEESDDYVAKPKYLIDLHDKNGVLVDKGVFLVFPGRSLVKACTKPKNFREFIRNLEEIVDWMKLNGVIEA